MGEDTKDCSEAARENGGDSESGRDTLEDLTKGRPHLISLLGQLAVTEKNPGDWIFQEGEEVHRCCYIVLGRVNLIAAGEVVSTVGVRELIGVDELLLREEHPIYVVAAQAVEPTNLVWLDEDGLISIMGHGALKGFLRLQAHVARQTRAALQRTKGSADKLATTAESLRRALRETQEDLVAKERLSNFPPRPAQAAPPPPHKSVAAAADQADLLAKLRGERETNQSIVRLMERRDKELETFLGELRQIIQKNPALEKNGELMAFRKRLEEAVTRRGNTVVNLKPL